MKNRDNFGRQKLGLLREQGLIPAELYGKGVENLHLQVAGKEFNKVFREAGESTIVNAVLENGERRPILIQNVDRDPLTGRIRHADFYQINMKEKIAVTVPINFTGEAPAVKKGGVLIKAVQEIEVEALPQFLPHALEVSVANLKEIEDSIHLKELKAGENVKIIGDPETVVATIIEPTQEETEETIPEEAPAATAPSAEKETAPAPEAAPAGKPEKKK